MGLPVLVRPTGYPGWASGPSGIGAGRVVEPTSAKKATGWQDSEAPPATSFNWAQNLYYQWIKNFDESRAYAHVGDGSDGDLILVNQTFVATRQMQIRDLAIGFSGVFKPNGFPHGVQLLTGVSGVIEGIAGDGEGGHSGGAGSSGFGGVGASGPLRGQQGFAFPEYGTTGTSSVFFPSRAAWYGLGGAGGTGGLGGGPLGVSYTPYLINKPPAPTNPPGPWQRLPQWLDGLWQQCGPTGLISGYVGGGAAGIPGVGVIDAPGQGGAGGEHIRMMIAEANWQGIVRSRGGRGGSGYYPGTPRAAVGGGGGGGGGSAGFGIGRKTRFDVTLDFSGGLGGVAAAGASGGATGLPGLAGPTGYIELPLP